MISPNDANKGLVFRYEGKILKIIDKHHVKLSKGGACQQAKCRDLKSGATINLRLNVSDDLEQVYVDKKVLQYNHFDGQMAKFYDNEEATEIEIDPSELGDIAPLFSIRGKLGITLMVQLESLEDKGQRLIIDSKIVNKDDLVFEVIQTSPSLKGEMAKPTDKPATLKGGLKVDVPPHVETGDKVILNKTNLSYESKTR